MSQFDQNEFVEFIDLCNRYTIYTCSKKIQEDKIIECKEFIEKIKYYKHCVTQNNIEEIVMNSYLNNLFHMQWCCILKRAC